MLLLESLDPSRRFASFLAISGTPLEMRGEFAHMAEVAADLGYRDLLLHFAKKASGIAQLEAYVGPERRSQRRGCLGRTEFPGSLASSTVATLPRFEFVGRVQENQVLYEFTLESSPQSVFLLDEALHLALATWGEEDDSLFELRTALFEIGSHFLDHAELLSTHSGSSHASEIQLALQLSDDGIRGWISDDGPPYDPSCQEGAHLHDEVAVHRFGGGESPGWFCRLLDEYEHVLEGGGNRIGFHKKVVR